MKNLVLFEGAHLHTSAYVSIRRHTTAYVGILEHTAGDFVVSVEGAHPKLRLLVGAFENGGTWFFYTCPQTLKRQQ